LPENSLQYILLILAALLCRMPYVGKVLRVFNTMLHESGHALMALITNGKTERIDLFADTSGQALTKSSNSFLSFLVVMAGYPFASVATWGMYILLAQKQYYFLLILSALLMLINLIFWVRNSYGIVWLFCFLLVIGFLFYLENQLAIELCALVFCAVALAESVYSGWTVFYLSIKTPKSSGDAKLLSEMAILPAFFWGLLFFIQSLWFGFLSLKSFWKVYPISL
jgi:hypothetical protein